MIGLRVTDNWLLLLMSLRWAILVLLIVRARSFRGTSISSFHWGTLSWLSVKTRFGMLSSLACIVCWILSSESLLSLSQHRVRLFRARWDLSCHWVWISEELRISTGVFTLVSSLEYSGWAVVFCSTVWFLRCFMIQLCKALVHWVPFNWVALHIEPWIGVFALVLLFRLDRVIYVLD